MYYNKISVIIIRQVMSKNDFSMYSGIYSSNDGMNTKVWGPHLWNFLFISIAGRYPIKIEKNNQEHKMIKNYFKSLFPEAVIQKGYLDDIQRVLGINFPEPTSLQEGNQPNPKNQPQWVWLEYKNQNKLRISLANISPLNLTEALTILKNE